MQSSAAPFGSHRPSFVMSTLLILTRLGLSRGKIRRWITIALQNQGASIIDRQVHGVKYRLHITKNTTDNRLLTSSKYYDRPEINALVGSRPGGSGRSGVFIDLGANTGYYTLELWKHGFERVLAIEPNPVTLGILKENIRLNQAEDVIQVVASCVGEGGEADFFTSGGLGSASLLRKHHPQAHVIRVPTKPLLQILDEQGVEKIDAMKVDIEGFEDAALAPFFAAAPETRWPGTMVIEHCNAEDWSTDIIAVLKDKGYRQTMRTRANTVLTKLNA